MHDIDAALDRHFRIRLTDKEILAVSRCLQAFFRICTDAGIKPSTEKETKESALVTKALDKFAKALGAGPDLVTMRKN